MLPTIQGAFGHLEQFIVQRVQLRHLHVWTVGGRILSTDLSVVLDLFYQMSNTYVQDVCINTVL